LSFALINLFNVLNDEFSMNVYDKASFNMEMSCFCLASYVFDGVKHICRTHDSSDHIDLFGSIVCFDLIFNVSRITPLPVSLWVLMA